MSDACVVVDNLVKRFGSLVAVDGISFSVKKGEVLGFLGPNGAGKSTTMRMATGYLLPTSGAITINGINVVEEPFITKSMLGYLPEGGPLYADMRVGNFLQFIAEVRSMQGTLLRDRLEFVISHLQIESVLDKHIETLSKGYKRRVALAQAILHDPEVLILDEPTDGLDPNQKFEVRHLIQSMAKDKVIIISTHILEEVEAVCDRALIINQGKIVAQGSPGQLMEQSPHYQSVVVECASEKDVKALDGLKKDKRIQSIQSVTGLRVIIIPANKQDITEVITSYIQKEKIHVRAVYVSPGQLEEAFRAVTSV